jgi:hypothetical protein
VESDGNGVYLRRSGKIAQGLNRMFADESHWPDSMKEGMAPFKNRAVWEFLRRVFASGSPTASSRVDSRTRLAPKQAQICEELGTEPPGWRDVAVGHARPMNLCPRSDAATISRILASANAG